MKRICVLLFTTVFLIFNYSIISLAAVLDPARESGEAEKAGYDLDSMPFEIEELENGDTKIWYIDMGACFCASKSLEGRRIYG